MCIASHFDLLRLRSRDSMQVESVLRDMHRGSILVIVNSLHHCCCRIHIVKHGVAVIIVLRRVSLRYGFLRICATIGFHPLKIFDVIIIVSELLLILENLVILILLLLILLLLMVEHS